MMLKWYNNIICNKRQTVTTYGKATITIEENKHLVS